MSRLLDDVPADPKVGLDGFHQPTCRRRLRSLPAAMKIGPPPAILTAPDGADRPPSPVSVANGDGWISASDSD